MSTETTNPDPIDAAPAVASFLESRAAFYRENAPTRDEATARTLRAMAEQHDAMAAVVWEIGAYSDFLARLVAVAIRNQPFVSGRVVAAQEHVALLFGLDLNDPVDAQLAREFVTRTFVAPDDGEVTPETILAPVNYMRLRAVLPKPEPEGSATSTRVEAPERAQ